VLRIINVYLYFIAQLFYLSHNLHYSDMEKNRSTEDLCFI